MPVPWFVKWEAVLMGQESVVGNINWMSFYPWKASGFACRVCSDWNVDKAARCATWSRRMKVCFVFVCLFVCFSLKALVALQGFLNDGWRRDSNSPICHRSFLFTSAMSGTWKAKPWSTVLKRTVPSFFGVPLLCSQIRCSLQTRNPRP